MSKLRLEISVDDYTSQSERFHPWLWLYEGDGHRHIWHYNVGSEPQPVRKWAEADAERQAEIVAGALRAAGHDVEVLTIEKEEL